MTILAFPATSTGQARITIPDINDKQGEVSSKHFGCFFEFLEGFINGPTGLWAQEIVNRGFDLREKDVSGVSYPWIIYNPQQTYKDKIELLQGGYNENGKFFQRIIKTSKTNFYGISES